MNFCLSSSVRVVDEVPHFVAATQFLLARGICVPADVSIISTDDHIAFSHCEPAIACIRWDLRPVVRRLIYWAAKVSRGKADFVQTLTSAEMCNQCGWQALKNLPLKSNPA